MCWLLPRAGTWQRSCEEEPEATWGGGVRWERKSLCCRPIGPSETREGAPLPHPPPAKFTPDCPEWLYPRRPGGRRGRCWVLQVRACRKFFVLPAPHSPLLALSSAVTNAKPGAGVGMPQEAPTCRVHGEIAPWQAGSLLPFPLTPTSAPLYRLEDPASDLLPP